MTSLRKKYDFICEYVFFVVLLQRICYQWHVAIGIIWRMNMIEQTPQTIVVTGRGTCTFAPDVTRLTIRISADGKNYPVLYKLAQLNLQSIIQIVEQNDLSDKLPKTLHFDINKKEERRYDMHGNFVCNEFVGYTLEQQIKIDLPIDNKLLTVLIQAIGQTLSAAEINIGYTVKDSKPIKLRMLESAVKDAAEKAQIMATAAGCKLGCVRNINYVEQELQIYSQVRTIECNQLSFVDGESLEITPDNLVASQDVTITWLLFA